MNDTQICKIFSAERSLGSIDSSDKKDTDRRLSTRRVPYKPIPVPRWRPRRKSPTVIKDESLVSIKRSKLTDKSVDSCSLFKQIFDSYETAQNTTQKSFRLSQSKYGSMSQISRMKPVVSEAVIEKRVMIKQNSISKVSAGKSTGRMYLVNWEKTNSIPP